MLLKTIVSLAVFGGELLNNPRPVGSPAPSSRTLARRIAAFLPPRPRGYVIELGAGTGPVTSALLERGVPRHRLLPVERSPKMVKLLRERFPGMNVLAGDAADLGALLEGQLDVEKDQFVSYVVSSLPLRSLPLSEVARITSEVQRVLGRKGKLIQYTYDLRPRPHRSLSSFSRSATTVVWRNFPPARVDLFEPIPEAGNLEEITPPASGSPTEGACKSRVPSPIPSQA